MAFINNIEKGVLRPEIGWAVREQSDRFGKLLDKIQQEHITEPPVNWLEARLHGTPKEFIQMLERFDGATLYAESSHPWQITKCISWSNYYDISETLDCCYFLANPFIDIVDGRSIAFNFNFRSRECWFLLGYRENEFANSVVIAKSIPEFFGRIFAGEGSYYFDEARL